MKAIIPILALLLLFTFCRKEDRTTVDAIIIGEDRTRCGCCGGFKISINGETDQYKLIKNAEEFGISSSDSFPIYVNVSWKQESTCNAGDIIMLKSLRRK